MNSLDLNVFDIVTNTPANPAGGADISFSVPANARIQPVYMQVSLITDANVADRLVYVGGNDGTNNINLTAAPAVQAANLTRTYFFAIGGVQVDLGSSITWLFAPLADEMYLREGDSVIFNVQDIQVGDQLASAVIRFKQWTQE